MSIIKDYPLTVDFYKNLLKNHIPRLCLFIFENGFNAVSKLILPYLAKYQTDQLVSKHISIAWFIWSPFVVFVIIIAITFVVKIFFKVMDEIISYVDEQYKSHFDIDFFNRIYSRLKNVELWVYSNPKNTNVFSNIIDSRWLIQTITSFFGEWLEIIIFLWWSFWLLYSLDGSILVWLSVAAILYYLFFIVQDKIDIYARFDDREVKQELRNAKYIIWHSFHKLAYMGSSDFLINKIESFERLQRSKVLELKKKKSIISQMQNLVEIIIDNGIIIAIAYWIYYHSESVGTMVMATTLLSTLSRYLKSILGSHRKYERLIEDLSSCEMFLWLTKDKMQTNVILSDPSSIKLSHITFSYPHYSEYEYKYFQILLRRLNKIKHMDEYDKNRIHALDELLASKNHPNPDILKNISLEFEIWKISAIVGRNWSGKTTLMHLLMNYYRDYTWSISRWALDQKSLSFYDLESMISVIEQEPFVLYWFTIRDNIIWLNNTIQDDEIYRLLDMFNMGDVIRKLRKWLDMKLQYDTNFSGGQLQLISLLRIYFQNKKIIILDEWTNQLDAENESKIMDLLYKQKHEKIIIVISHRMTSVMKADVVFCMEQWVITSSGTPKELLWRKDNLFSLFWEEQVGQI